MQQPGHKKLLGLLDIQPGSHDPGDQAAGKAVFHKCRQLNNFRWNIIKGSHHTQSQGEVADLLAADDGYRPGYPINLGWKSIESRIDQFEQQCSQARAFIDDLGDIVGGGKGIADDAIQFRNNFRRLRQFDLDALNSFIDIDISFICGRAISLQRPRSMVRVSAGER